MASKGARSAAPARARSERAAYDAYGNRVVGNVGDLNLDGFTDDADFVLYSTAYNHFTDVTGDLNFDDVINS